MKTRYGTLSLVGALTAFIITTQDTSAFYNPNTGRWLSRDPIGDFAFARNMPMAELINAFATQQDSERDEPAADLADLYGFVRNEPTSRRDRLGLISETGGMTSTGPRHDNYVEFHVSCPAGSRFKLTGLDYTWVRVNLLALGFTPDFLESLGTLGGLVPGSPEGVNCNGRPVTIRGYMRTRLILMGGHRAADAYGDNLILNYECILDCCPGIPPNAA